SLHLPEVADMDGHSFLPVLKGEKQKHRNVVFTQLHKLFSGSPYPMRCVQRGNYGYIVNFWSDGDFSFRGEALSGRTFRAMTQAASSDQEIAERISLLKFRVREELYDFRNDPDGLVNLNDNPDFAEEKKN